MKKNKILALLCCLCMLMGLLAGCTGGNDGKKGSDESYKELGVSVTFMSPNTKDDAQQIESVNNAVSGGYNAIIVAANGPDAISSALKDAQSKGVKIV